MLSGLSEWVTDVIRELGYVGVALLVALENLFPPIPSEIVLPFAGFVASDGDATLPGMIVAATIGSLVGAWVLYGIAAWIGPDAPRAVPDPLWQVVQADTGRHRQGRAVVRPAGRRRRAHRPLHPADPLADLDPRRVPADAVRHVHAVHGGRLTDLELGADRRRLPAARQLGGRRAGARHRADRRHRR